MGNTMSKCVLKHFRQHVKDQEIKIIVQDALNLNVDFFQDI